MAYYWISEFARLIGVTSVTLRAWDKADKLKPHHISPTGYRYYSEEQLQDYLGGSYGKRGDVDDRHQQI